MISTIISKREAKEVKTNDQQSVFRMLKEGEVAFIGCRKIEVEGNLMYYSLVYGQQFEITQLADELTLEDFIDLFSDELSTKIVAIVLRKSEGLLFLHPTW